MRKHGCYEIDSVSLMVSYIEKVAVQQLTHAKDRMNE